MQRGASERTAPKTTVQLIGFRSPYRDECPRDLDAIAHRLFAHILPLFLDPDVPAITLADEATEIDLRAFFDEQFRAPASKHEFKVGGRDFTLHGFRLYGGAANHHELVYGSHYREVITERLAKFLPNLTNRLSDAEDGNFAYLAFVQGGYLDEKVNAERTDFSIPATPRSGAPIPASSMPSSWHPLTRAWARLSSCGPSKQPVPRTLHSAWFRADFSLGPVPSGFSLDLFADEISLRAIRDAGIAAITSDLKPYLEEINSAKQAALIRYIARKRPSTVP